MLPVTLSAPQEAAYPPDRKVIIQAWQRSVATHEPFTVEHRLVRVNRDPIWVLTTAAPCTIDSLGRAWVGTGTAAALLRRIASGVIGQNHAHEFGCEGVEVSAI